MVFYMEIYNSEFFFLERYISEFNTAESHHLSERYYLQAFCLNSQNGIPHNQLGSLYSNRFDSAYHYMRW